MIKVFHHPRGSPGAQAVDDLSGGGVHVLLQQHLEAKAARTGRIAAGLLTLRRQLEGAQGVPAKTTGTNLLVATWNIREFGGGKFERCPDSYYFIAEIIDILIWSPSRRSVRIWALSSR